VRQRQRVVLPEARDVDVIAMAGHVVQVFFVRGGKLIDRQSCNLKNDEGASDAEMMASFVPQFYQGGAYVPEEIVFGTEFEPDGLQAWLERKRQGKVLLSFPKAGPKRDWVRMVEENARQMLQEAWAEGEAPAEAGLKAAARDLQGGLGELQSVFKLQKPPRRIEGFDISHIQGSHTVASMVVLLDGRPRNAEYRHYKIKSVEGVDDFASMQEVVGRRYRRLLEERKPLPDLVLIDGGKGQLGAALKALDGLGLGSLPCFGLAKRLEEIFVPGREESIRLNERSPGRLMIQRLRDEAHRFAITYHRKLRAKAIRHSLLDEAKGVGPKLKGALLKRFGSVEGVRAASDEELGQLKGMGAKVIAALREALK
jgi:excinuclease ABC subunit C